MMLKELPYKANWNLLLEKHCLVTEKDREFWEFFLISEIYGAISKKYD